MYVGNNPLIYTDRIGTEKKFIGENEGNAWYISTTNAVNWDSWHAMLYYILNWKEHIVSFEPLNFDNWIFEDNKWFFDTSEIEIKRAKQYMKNWSSTFISKEYLNVNKVNNWLNSEITSTPSYNTKNNNCSTEVRKALKAWWIDILPVLETPWNLEQVLNKELSRQRVDSFFNNLF